MIKNNPSSKQESDLCKKTVMGYFGYFYHAEIGLFNPANGVEKKNGWQLRKPQSALDVVCSGEISLKRIYAEHLDCLCDLHRCGI